MHHVLVVDDERELSNILATLLMERGYSVECAISGETALASAGARTPDLVLLDLHLGGIDGMEVLRRLRASHPNILIVMTTAYGNVQAAVTAMKLGAADFVVKPFNNEALLATIDALLSPSRRVPGVGGSKLAGQSAKFREAMSLAMKFAVPDINILLHGETGTGKELFARAIHDASKRRNGPFVPVDCSTLSESLFESELFGHEKGSFTGAVTSRMGRLEQAQGGTLFLDEIGNLPLGMQAKLLRVLQERTAVRVGGREIINLDVRVISATHVNLKEAAAMGKFREDLYYRLNEMTVPLPALRERASDIPLIAAHFVGMYAGRFGKSIRGLSDEAIELLEAHHWPGNVRELENVVKAATVLADDVVRPEHLPAALREQKAPPTPVPPARRVEADLDLELNIGLDASEIDLKAVCAEAAERAERWLLLSLINRRRLSGAQMAKLLNVDPKTLRTKLRKYGLDQHA